MTIIVGMILAFSDARSGRWTVSAHTPIFLLFFWKMEKKNNVNVKLLLFAM